MMHPGITNKIKAIYHESCRHKARMIYFLPWSVKNKQVLSHREAVYSYPYLEAYVPELPFWIRHYNYYSPYSATESHLSVSLPSFAVNNVARSYKPINRRWTQVYADKNYKNNHLWVSPLSPSGWIGNEANLIEKSAFIGVYWRLTTFFRMNL